MGQLNEEQLKQVYLSAWPQTMKFNYFNYNQQQQPTNSQDHNTTKHETHVYGYIESQQTDSQTDSRPATFTIEPSVLEETLDNCQQQMHADS